MSQIFEKKKAKKEEKKKCLFRVEKYVCVFKFVSSLNSRSAGLWVRNDLIVLTSNVKNTTTGTHEAQSQGCSDVLVWI